MPGSTPRSCARSAATGSPRCRCGLSESVDDDRRDLSGSPDKRHRSTKAEVRLRRENLNQIVSAMKPMTVRQVFYQATVRGIVEKCEAGYAKVQTDLVLMRRAGEMPVDWLADNTRWQRKPRTEIGR